MPTYDDTCPDNGLTVEVHHGIADSVESWGDLCRRAGIDPGGTPESAPVARVLSGGILAVKNRVSLGGAPAPNTKRHVCGSGCSH